MNVRSLCFLLFFFSFLDRSPLHAQSRYWIVFRDKGIARAEFHAGNPTFEKTRKLLTNACLARRSVALHAPPIATVSLEDAPICPRYLDCLRTLGIVPIREVRWVNAVSAILTDTECAVLRRLSFITSVDPVLEAHELSTEPIPPVHKIIPMLLQSVAHSSSNSGGGYDTIVSEYGGSGSQLDRINVWPLHAMGFDGSGVRLGFLDVGFNWRAVSSLDRSNVLFEHDYVFQDSITAGPQDQHGTETLSTAMGYLPDTLMGPAYRTSVMLAHTEDIRSEHNVEEDNYAAALEDFEARGVEITSSSLGYFTFDSGQHSYSYADMNGHTTICTQAVERAAKLGVLVVTAMGNNGADTVYPHEQAPADADSILACGALDVNDSIAGFSSLGPTYDGRIKPDICAPGVDVFVQERDGTFSPLAGGTSFATPLVSGACCVIKQTHPEATAQEIRQAVMITGRRATHPDTVYGWGEIDTYAAALELGPVEHVMNISVDTDVRFYVGAAAKFGIIDLSLEYYYNTDTVLTSVPLRLAADSLVYSGAITNDRIANSLFYRVVLEDRNGTIATFPASGWNEFSLTPSELRLSLYPNPSGPALNIQSNEVGSWMLYDQTGKTMLDGTAGIGLTTASLSGLSNGVYYFKLTSANGETKVLPVAVRQ